MRVFEVVSLDFGGTLAYEVSDDRLVYREILSELGYWVGVEDIGKALRDARSWWRAEKRECLRISKLTDLPDLIAQLRLGR